MGTYNGVWLNLYRRYVKGEKDDVERQPVLPSYDDATDGKPGRDYDTTQKNAVNS